ncbi:MAG: Rrf2 family transcriptional regulator [Cyclobacteriaceae bacterium]
MFSRACEYAIKIMIFIASNEQGGKRTGLKEIIKAIDSPEAFTAKILQQLVKAGLLKSFKGPNGGFTLYPSKKITLKNIVIAIDGEALLTNCVLGLPECSGDNPCPVHFKFVEVKAMLNDILLSTDLRNEAVLKDTTLKI